jgi:hypothetical protein
MFRNKINLGMYIRRGGEVKTEKSAGGSLGEMDCVGDVDIDVWVSPM